MLQARVPVVQDLLCGKESEKAPYYREKARCTVGRPLKTTFDMTTLIFSSGGCPSYPFYPLKRIPSYPFLVEKPSSEGATKDHLSSNLVGNPPELEIKVNVS